MFIRAYLRASTEDQNADRAREQLTTFAKEKGHSIACYYTENASGASLKRQELHRLLSDAQPGDILLIEQVDRLTRLPEKDWKLLKRQIEDSGLHVVALDLPTSHMALQKEQQQGFTQSMLAAINQMMLDMLAAIANKDYEDRRRRQQQGIIKAKAEGRYTGRRADQKKQQMVIDLKSKGFSLTQVQQQTGYSRSSVCRILQAHKAKEAAG